MAVNLPKGLIRMTESTVTYLGCGFSAKFGKQWTKLAGGITYDMSQEADRNKLERLWTSLQKPIIAAIESKRTSDVVLEDVRKFNQLDTAMKQSGWTGPQMVLSPQTTPPPASSATPRPSVVGTVPQPSTPLPQTKTPMPALPPETMDDSSRTRRSSM